MSNPSTPESNGIALASVEQIGRDRLGRFGVGNKLSKGNAANRRLAELRRAALQSEGAVEVAAVVGKLRELALEGDVQAAKVYLEHVVGKPVQALELSGPEGGPVGLNVVEVVVEALRDFPQARIAVAARLRELSHARHADDPA